MMQLQALKQLPLLDPMVLGIIETIAAFGPNGSRNHHQPGPRRLKKIDTILLDFGAKYKGYCSDVTRCFAVGKVTPRYQQVYETVARSQQRAIECLNEGVKAADADIAAREIIESENFSPYGHGLGHGLGLEVHEGPRLSSMDIKTKLKAGHVVTVEPGIYLPGKFGIRLEDDVLVTESGAKILTRDKRFDIDPLKIPLLRI
jgi:Xaa-Pro aminopeptidase